MLTKLIDFSLHKVLQQAEHMMNATVTLDSVYRSIENINQIVKERKKKDISQHC